MTRRSASKNENCQEKCSKSSIYPDLSLITKLENAVPNITGYFPPDPILAVGPKTAITMVNTSIAIFNKKTLERIYFDSLTNFFESESSGDPWIVYDEYSKRFVLCDFSVAPDSSFTLLRVGVSKNSTPKNSKDFYKYVCEVPLFADYPKLAVDREGLYISTLDFVGGEDGSTAGNSIRAFKIKPLLDGSSPVNISPIYEKTFPVNDDNAWLRFLFPAQPRYCKYDKKSYKVLFIQGVDNSTFYPGGFKGDKLRVYQIKKLLSAPVAVYAEVTVPPFVGSAFEVPQPPPNIPIPEDEDIVGLAARQGRFMTGVVANKSLWAAHMLSVQPDLTRSTSVWYQIDVSKFLSCNTVSLVQSGNVDAGGETNQIYPAINVDKHGNMGIQFTLVGRENYPTVAYTGRLKEDPLGKVRLPYQLVAGGNLYYQYLVNGQNRWGDYSGLAIDPKDHETFWLFSEYPIVTDQSDWTTVLAAFKIEKCGGSVNGTQKSRK